MSCRADREKGDSFARTLYVNGPRHGGLRALNGNAGARDAMSHWVKGKIWGQMADPR